MCKSCGVGSSDTEIVETDGVLVLDNRPATSWLDPRLYSRRTVAACCFMLFEAEFVPFSARRCHISDRVTCIKILEVQSFRIVGLCRYGIGPIGT